jgi:hypothetical protein
MIDFRRGVGNVAVLRWGASGIARNTQIYIYLRSGYEPEELSARTREVQPGFPFATWRRKSIRLIARLQPVSGNGVSIRRSLLSGVDHRFFGIVNLT